MDNTSDFGEVISSYTRGQAIEDGVLVDLTPLAQEAGFRYPVAVTRSVWEILSPGDELRAQGQSLDGRAWDLFMILRFALRESKDRSFVSFSPMFVQAPGALAKSVQLHAVCGPGEDTAPVVTIMLPGED